MAHLDTDSRILDRIPAGSISIMVSWPKVSVPVGWGEGTVCQDPLSLPEV